mmetsp:Transcript_22667/g.40095  ORF Transcript_22667/g.40095 Transcript_22667/m.40095 type:complete len:235 (-) Transcript_22667:241-945(-)|eukprot:CAMPEP_0197537454 /NCGR_PEP_ID=MMETSP1318-20131121/56909_1 /TAXON_ID=552666 /ORGANISM="Partenskyella glossopodia, Strain RCC365" /LENGTH=234 /DNA_ID=CAMNT_0043095629 /DNA_START=21 /DNA_END=725 /DNA_ORIENTATION=-
MAEGKGSRGAVIFLHGSGDNGKDFRSWLLSESNGTFEKTLSDASLLLLTPSAIPIQYSLLGGQKSTVWHDRKGLGLDEWEDVDGIARSRQYLEEACVTVLERQGIPRSRIVIGGFSQGGHMALHLAEQKGKSEKNTYAGCFVMSSYLHKSSILYNREQGGISNETPLLMTHGSADSLISPKWGINTAERLKSLGKKLDFKLFQGVDHSLSCKSLDEVLGFVLRIFEGIEHKESK